MPNFNAWKTDNYKFVGKAFDFAYADRLNKLSPVVGEVNAKSIDYELTGSGGYGEAPVYDGESLNEGSLHRGFKTIITPVEYSKSIGVGYKQAKIDKMVVDLVQKQYEKAKTILTENKASLDKIAHHLYEKETITGEEFMDILNGQIEEPAE